MPFKHTVTDSRGKVHTRTSAERQYGFAVVHHVPEHTWEGRVYAAYSRAEWSSQRHLAEKVANQWRGRGYEVEIIPCTPEPTGKHKAA